MGTCIICGTPVDGEICKSHEQDVVFEFKGNSPQQLTPGRFYRGSVDGFAEFGVFVDIGEYVTGLLHRSELDRRLETLDWDEGQTVYVLVKGVRDNGNVDLGWSIRQSESEFRGALVDDPDAPADAGSTESEQSETPRGNRRGESATVLEPKPRQRSKSEPDVTGTEDGVERESESRGEDESASEGARTRVAELERVEIGSLSDRVDDRVRIEGEVAGIRQTGGPTIFEVRDETGVVNCAAFKEAGVRAYPEVELGDLIRLDGEVELRHNELQVETEALTVLADDERETVEERLADALAEQARPSDVGLFAEQEAVVAIHDAIRDAAEAVRRAVIESRPVIVRHTATADGYVAGAALERATLPLVRDEHASSDAEYHYFDRRPLRDNVYDMDAATGDVTSMLDNRERHDEKLPLIVLVDAGSTAESTDGLSLLSIYGAERAVIDVSYPDQAVTEHVDTIVNPFLAGTEAEDVTTSVLAANVAAHVNPDVRDEIRHLPAVSYWEDTPEAYVELAAEADYDESATRELREAVALEAYYQSYEDKRELIADLLFDGVSDLAGHISEQFRTKLEAEVETAEANLRARGHSGVSFAILDTDAYTHRFDFPPTDLLLDAIHRDQRGRADPFVTLGVADDELHVRSTEPVDVRALAGVVRETVPDGGVEAKGTRNGRLEFLVGEREAVLDATVEAIAEQLS